MRLTKRQRRRALAAVLGVTYLGIFAWFVSPLWGSPAGAASEKVPVRAVPQGRSLGVALGKPEALPGTLPGSNAGGVTSEEATGSETVSESGSEEVPVASEGGEASSGSSSGGEASQSPPEKQIVSSEG